MGSTLTVRSFYDRAAQAEHSAQILLIAGIDGPYHTWPFSFYLYHLSAELLLKSYRLGMGASLKSVHGHDLISQYDECIKLGLVETEDARLILKWLNLYGAFDGGTKYPKPMNGGYAFPIQLLDQLTVLADDIAARIDLDAEIA